MYILYLYFIINIFIIYIYFAIYTTLYMYMCIDMDDIDTNII